MPETILQRIGTRGLLRVVWEASRPAYRPLTPLYALWVYKGIFGDSHNLQELRDLHGDRFRGSFLFRLLRPRFSVASRILRERFGVD